MGMSPTQNLSGKIIYSQGTGLVIKIWFSQNKCGFNYLTVVPIIGMIQSMSLLKVYIMIGVQIFVSHNSLIKVIIAYVTLVFIYSGG